jgi:cytochrome P450
MSNTQLWGIAALAKDPQVQRKAFESVLRRKTLPELHDVEHDHDDYVTALVKEVNRYYDALRIPPPRETIGKDIVWQGHYIPAGTTFYLNSYAINRGTSPSAYLL